MKIANFGLQQHCGNQSKKLLRWLILGILDEIHVEVRGCCQLHNILVMCHKYLRFKDVGGYLRGHH